MEMSIDEAIKEMELEFNNFLEGNDLTTPDIINRTRESIEDFDRVYTANLMAIDIMYKYRQIERIIKWIEYDKSGIYHTNRDMIDEIREVIYDKRNWRY